MIAEAVEYLGPARVLGISGQSGYVQIARPDNRVMWARLAMAMPYSPERADEVLVISGNASEAYVIGLLDGQGVTTLRVANDLRLEAPNGCVHISAGRVIQMRSGESFDMSAPRGTLRFERMNLIAMTLVQRVNNAFTWATGLVQSKSRRLRLVADEGWLVRAGRAHLKTTENIHINGRTVHLG